MSINLRDPAVLYELRSMKVSLIPDPTNQDVKDSGMDLPTGFLSHAVQSGQPEPRYLRPNSLIYIPPNQEDWVEHPQSWRAMQVIVYQVKPTGAVSVTWLRIGTVFFVLSNQKVGQLLDGSMTETDLLVELESGLPA